MSYYQNHLIIGANGKTGSRVMQRLQQMALAPKGASRNGDVRFDWENRTTWQPALQNIDAVYLTYFPDLAMPQAPDDIRHFCELAKAQGVKHITLLSGRGEEAAQVCEGIVQNSGLSWTIVRAAWFNQNFSEGLFRQFILQGKMALPVSGMREPFVDIDDIAEVVSASLTDKQHRYQLYEVTGPELLSFAELSQQFQDESGINLVFQSISLAEFQKTMTNAGASDAEVEMLSYLFSEVLDGRNEFLCDGVQQALGRPARSFRQFVQGNLAAFAEAL